MIRTILFSAYRSIGANKINSVINIAGLAISIACCIFIYVFVKNEYSFDNFHTRADRIYRVVLDDKGTQHTEYNGFVSFPVAKALRNDFPQLETVTQVYVYNTAVISIPGSNGEKKLFEDRQLTYADEFFFKTFDFKKLAGDDNLLSSPDEVVLTKSLADKFFGTSDKSGYAQLVGKSITVNKHPYRISAVLEDMPRNSNVACHLLLPFKVFERDNPELVKNWKDRYSESYTFVTLPQNYTASQFDAALVGFKERYLSEDDARHNSYHPQPLSMVHTDNKYGGTYYTTPSVLIWAFVFMGVVVLLTSCINFINLAVVQSFKRAKEIGIRKTLGSGKAQIVIRFMVETMLLVLLASGFAVLLANYFLQLFNEYLLFIVELGLHIDATILVFLGVLGLLITLLAGYYPAKVMASFQPIKALRHSIKAKDTGFSNRFSLRKALVITQFTVSQLLIIGTIIVATQMQYFRSRDLGYQKKGIYTVEIPENNPQKLALYRNKLMSLPQVKGVSFNSGPPTSASNGFSVLRKKEMPKTSNFSTERKFVDPHYLSTFNIKLVAGRPLQESDKVTLGDGTKMYNVLLNRKATSMLGFKTPGEAIGQQALVQDHEFATIVGVTEDFFNVSLQQEISPCLLFYATNWVGMASIRLDDAATPTTFSRIEEEWRSLFPDQVFKGMTLEYYIEHKAFYVIENIMYQGFKIFMVLALIIGCMGLYGLVAFLALQRQKEIGIRKVLGASVSGIVYLFSKEFTWMVLISFLIAAPLGFIAMKSWLQTFANRIPLHAGYFLGAFLLSLIIAGLTVGFQAVQAALANPVKSLKTE